MNLLLTGTLVRLAATDPENDPKLMTPWYRDSEFFRLAYGRHAEPWGLDKVKKRAEENALNPKEPEFAIRTLADDKMIGQVSIWLEQPHGDGFVAIIIGERDYWGKGYGTDAMRILLRFAFQELNLHRVSLRTFGFNPRAIRSYEKVGFKHEGRMRGALNRIGQRWDDVSMAILASDWAKDNSK